MTGGIRGRTAKCVVVGAVLVAATAVGEMSPAVAATSVVAHYDMNESSGSTLMRDRGPAARHGAIGPDVDVGRWYDGAVGYRFPWRHPSEYPARPERLVTVPSADVHQPGNDDFAVEFRYRTSQNFGNVIQKGQNASQGGYWKFEQPNGLMTCLFKDANGRQRAVKSPVPTNDDEWHTIRCELSDWGIRLYGDGVLMASRRTSMGSVSNNQPLSIGGKSSCDQVKVSCDYFVGWIEDIKFEKSGGAPPVNQPPNAAFDVGCDGVACSFDGSGSGDPDGQVTSWAWRFGDGTTGNGELIDHEFAGPGTYDVELTVTDDQGATDRRVLPVAVDVPQAGGVSFVGSASIARYSSSPRITTPAVEPGDTLLLFTSVASPVWIGEPSTSGWELVDTADGAKGGTKLWWKTATATDSGRLVSVPIERGAKTHIAVVAYRGASATDPVTDDAFDIDRSYTSSRTAPAVGVDRQDSTVVSFWFHRDSSTSALTAPSGVAARVSDTMSGGGHPTVLVADVSGVPTGAASGRTATATGPSTFGITWSVVIAPG